MPGNTILTCSRNPAQQLCTDLPSLGVVSNADALSVALMPIETGWVIGLLMKGCLTTFTMFNPLTLPPEADSICASTAQFMEGTSHVGWALHLY